MTVVCCVGSYFQQQRYCEYNGKDCPYGGGNAERFFFVEELPDFIRPPVEVKTASSDGEQYKFP